MAKKAVVPQNPRDPFKPNVASPKLSTNRGQNAQVLSNNGEGQTFSPERGLKTEWRMSNNKRSGFNGINRKYREDGVAWVHGHSYK